MMTDDEYIFQQVDALLQKRKAAPEMPSGMVNRIMMAAGSRPARVSWWGLVQESFLIPRPVAAFVFALFLLGGVLVGMEMESFSSVWDEDWTGFLYIDEDII